MSKSYQMDMCHGPLFRKILVFTVPLIATNLLQLLFSAADMIVLGQFAPHEAMAAVGATVTIYNFFSSLFMGLGIGSNVLVAKYFGAGDRKGVRLAVHTAMTASVLCGLVLMVLGFFCVSPLLRLMGTPDNIFKDSCKYLYICFMGIPFCVIYNVGCGILRALGDTMRPMFFLLISGAVNLLLNVIFVVGLKMQVAGVAVATLLSLILSAVLILWVMFRSREESRLVFRRLKIDGPIFREMLGVGIPASIQSSCFSISNMTIQSSINSFGSYAIAGCTAASAVEGILWVSSYTFHTTALSFVAQNLGGKHFKRILKSTGICLLCGASASLFLGILFSFFAKELLSLYNPDPAVIRWGLVRVKILFLTYFMCGIMDVLSGMLRGLQHSVIATLGSLTGAFLFRVLWVFFVFPHYRTMENLMLSYPVSWILVIMIHCVCSWVILRKIFRERTRTHGRLFSALQNGAYRSGPALFKP